MYEESDQTERWYAEAMKAHAALDREDYEEARGLLGYALGEALCFGKENHRVGQVKLQMAMVALKTGDALGSLSLSNDAIEIISNAIDAPKENHAFALVFRSTVNSTLDNEAEALLDLEKAVAMLEERKGEIISNDKLRLSNYQVALASYKVKTGEIERALDILRRALALREEIYGKEDPNIIGILNRIYTLSLRINAPDSALLLERIKKIEEIKAKNVTPEDEHHSWLFTKLDVLDVLHIQEQAAYKKNREFLGEAVWLVQSLSELYDRLGILLGEIKDLDWTWQLLYAFTCCLHGCRYQLLIGTLTLCRGHRTDFAAYVRKAIEYSSFAIIMARNTPASKGEGTDISQQKTGKERPTPQKEIQEKKPSKTMAEIWIEAANSNNAFAKYRSNFDIMKALRLTGDLTPNLYKMYEELSKQVHPSSFSVVGQSKVENRPSELIHTFDYFEHKSEDQQKLIAYALFWSVKAHAEILEGLGKAIHQANTNFDIDTWSKELEKFQQRFEHEKKNWATLLDPDGKYRGIKTQGEI